MKSSRLLSLLAVLFLLPSSALAGDGSLAATSTGTSTVTVTIPDLVKITNVGNLSLGSYTGSGNLDANDDVCIFTNKAAATYYVTASGSGGSSAFEVTDGSNDLAYTAFFNDVSGLTGELSLATTVKTVVQSGASTTSQTCGGTPNANIHVHFDSAALQAVPSGAYSGTLTLLIEPN